MTQSRQREPFPGRMRVLLVHPEFPTTYWGFQHSLPFIGKRATLPPLGLLTLAALLPPAAGTMRLADLNVAPLSDDDVLWADAVLVGGMLVQAPSALEVIRRARTLGTKDDRRRRGGHDVPSAVPRGGPRLPRRGGGAHRRRSCARSRGTASRTSWPKCPRRSRMSPSRLRHASSWSTYLSTRR
jgi:hypothetical protein